MKLTFIGTGYVGLVTGVGFAIKGSAVCCVDVDEPKVKKINQGIAPIYEKDLASSLQIVIQNNNFKATTSMKEGLDFSNIIFIAVGTPPKDDGSPDMSYVNQVLDEILVHLNKDVIIINKSTVPVGTASKMNDRIQEYLREHNLSYKIHIISNPEFLREGEALQDFLYPDRIIIGGKNKDAMDIISDLYLPFVKHRNQIFLMDNTSAEMTKYAANAMLASRISFMNEISRLCEKTGANIDNVRDGIGADIRIGSLFLNAGIGYGGSCFPKDIDALLTLGQQSNAKTPMLSAIKESNTLQQYYFISKLENYFGSLQDKKLAIWGLAFKSGTDDVRESPSLNIIKELFLKGVSSFYVYDVEATEMAKPSLEGIPVVYCEDMYHTLIGQDALLIMTDAEEFINIDLLKLKSLMNPAVIFDGRNILDPVWVRSENIIYYSIGRV